MGARRPMSKVKMPDGAILSARINGVGRDVLFVSGLGGTAAVWDRAVGALGGSIRAITFDQRGIGESTRGEAAVSIESLAEDSWRLLDDVGEGRPFLVGHSMGGAIVQAMEQRRPGQAAGLAISASWAGPSRYMSALFRMRMDLLDKCPQAYASCVTLLAYPAGWLNANWDVYENAVKQAPDSATARLVICERTQALMAHDMRRDLRGMNAPTLVLGSKDDQVVPSFLQDELIELLPNAQTHWFDGGGHGFTETKPEEFARRLKIWMTELGA